MNGRTFVRARALLGGGGSTGGTDERFKQLVEGTLTEVNDSEITKIKQYGFSNINSLETVNLPSVESIEACAFSGCFKLSEVKLKGLAVPRNAFEMCYRLKKIDISFAESIGTYAFTANYSLLALILRDNTLCSLSSTTAFSSCYHIHGTPIIGWNEEGKKDGYIYVPSALIEQYKVATNWVTFADQFRALEDYTVDGTTTGELDWEKVNAA